MASSVFHIINSLAMLLWLSCAICGNTQESTLDCIPYIRVPRNTVWKAPEMMMLKINCSVETNSQCKSTNNFPVSWCRIDEKNNCKPLNHSNNTATEWSNITRIKSISFLIFQSLSMEDAGLYRCKLDEPVIVSHNINVTVTASHTDFEVVKSENKTTNGSRSVSENTEWLWPYVYICSGILVLILLVVTVPLLIIRCQRPKQEKTAGNQSSANQPPYFTSPVQDTSPRGNTHCLPAQLNQPADSIYDNAPIRVSSLRDDTPRSHPVNHRARPGQSCERFNMEDTEEESPLVYAALNHKVMSRGPVRVSHPEETSEYAAIRVS